MAEGKRPGGLTALAVLNFVFGGLGALGILAVVAMLSLAKSGMDAIKAGGGEVHYTGPSTGAIYLAILLSVVGTIVMIIAGVGYLKQKRFLGRTMGNVYAATSIASSIVGIALLKTGFGIGTIIGLIYPVLTLILINGTFKDDLVN